jgi:hypothetical protein
MRRITWLLIAVVVLGLLNFQPVTQAQEPTPLSLQGEFPSNSGFESGNFTNWSLSGTPGIWSVTTVDKHTGNYSAHALLTDATTRSVSTLTSNLYSVVGNQRTSLVFWLKAPQVTNGGKLVVQTEWYNASHVQLGSSGWTIRNTAVPDWTNYQIPMTLPTNAASLHVYLAALAYPGDTIEVYVDDFSSSAAGDPLLFLPLVLR